MSKVEIKRLDSVTANDTSATALINQNFQNIKEALDKALFRDGSIPNYMLNVLDMNSNRIINTAEPTDDFDVVNKRYLDSFVGTIQQQVKEVQDAAQAALEKAQNAARSATSAARDAASAQESARDAAEDAATSAQAASDIEGYLADPNLVAVGTDLRKGDDSLIAQAVDAADIILSTEYAQDLSFSSYKLQLLDQHNNPLGTSVQLSKVASTGAYSDLSGKPAINNATITFKQGGSVKGSFTTNQSSNQTIELDAGGGGGSSLPDQTGNAGKFLSTDGTDASWDDLPIDSYVDEYSTNDSAVGSKLFYDTCGDIEAALNTIRGV